MQALCAHIASHLPMLGSSMLTGSESEFLITMYKQSLLACPPAVFFAETPQRNAHISVSYFWCFADSPCLQQMVFCFVDSDDCEMPGRSTTHSTALTTADQKLASTLHEQLDRMQDCLIAEQRKAVQASCLLRQLTCIPLTSLRAFGGYASALHHHRN